MPRKAPPAPKPAAPAPIGPSATIGYARTSTLDQIAGLDAQCRDLTGAGCQRIFSEQVSATATHRPQLAAALSYLRAGDVLIVTKPDRLARSTADLMQLVARLDAGGIGLRILSMGGGELDTRGATGKLMLTVLAAIAAFERDLMLERQREGIARAREAGRYKGRAPTARAQADAVARLIADGVGPAEAARRLNISRASVYRIIGPASPAASL